MGLLDFFKNEDQAEVKKYSGLYDQLSQEYQQISEKDLVVLSCIAGLMARVAYVDFDLHDNEVKKMKELIKSWNKKIECIGGSNMPCDNQKLIKFYLS